jgi:hypothetical protein
MKSGGFKVSARVFLLIAVLLFLPFWASKPVLIGKWKKVDRVESLFDVAEQVISKDTQKDVHRCTTILNT